MGVRTAETIPHAPGLQASSPNHADCAYAGRRGRDARHAAAPDGPWHAARVNATAPSLLLDSPSLIYRAFFALPKSIRDPEGQSVNAAHGYLDMVSRLLLDHRPPMMTHVFDADWKPKFRVDAYPGYKAKRAEDPPELPGQFPVIRSVLDAAGLPVAEAAGYEADDVIGTLATAAGPKERIAIVTGDRDLFQLVRDPVVLVLFPRRGTSDMVRMDEAGVLAKCGVPANRYVDFAILRGDPSDGLPGVAGVGEKTAARLIEEYPTLDDLVAARDELSPRLASSLASAGEYLDAMRVVVPVATKLEVEATAPGAPDPERLEELGERHSLRGPVRRLLQAMRDAGLADPKPSAEG
jgi:5'-3' exonuclease